MADLVLDHPSLKQRLKLGQPISHQHVINALLEGTTIECAGEKAERYGLSMATLVASRPEILKLPEAGLLKILAEGRTLSLWNRGSDVRVVMEALEKAGFPPGEIDGVYGEKGMAPAVKKFAEAHGISSDGKSVTPQILTALLRTAQTSAETAAVSLAVQQLASELVTVKPDFLLKVRAELDNIRALGTDAEKSAALTALFSSVDGNMQGLIAQSMLSEKGLKSWVRVREHTEAAIQSGTLLKEVRSTKDLLEPQMLASFEQQVSAIAKECSELMPEEFAPVLKKTLEVSRIQDPGQKLQAIQSLVADIDGKLAPVQSRLSPATQESWKNVKFELTRSGTKTLTMADLAGTALMVEGLAFLQKDVERIGQNPQNAALSEELTKRLIEKGRKVDSNPNANGPLTVEQLRKIVPKLSLQRAKELVPHLNAAMIAAGCKTPRERAAYIAQNATESGGFQWMKEMGGPSYFAKMYNPNPFPGESSSDAARRARRAKNLGNTERDDGVRFPGRGTIQLTGRNNYGMFSKWLYPEDPEKLLRNPELVETPELAFKVGSWFWTVNDLNSLIRRSGDHMDNFRVVTKRINGGYNGWDERVRFYMLALDAMDV